MFKIIKSKSFNGLKNAIEVQTQNGNWNYDEYMLGMTNGLICAMAILEGKEPEYYSKPYQWLKDKKLTTPTNLK